jgi:hypothetical protein
MHCCFPWTKTPFIFQITKNLHNYNSANLMYFDIFAQQFGR